MKIKTYKKDEGRRIKNFICKILHDELAIDSSIYPHTDLDDFENAYGGDREVFFCMEDKGKIIGTAAIKFDDDQTALLRRLFVKLEYRGRGIGRRLLDDALKYCKKHHYARVCFRCTERMQAAKALCQSYGFSQNDCAELGEFKIFLLEKKLEGV